MRMTVKTKDFYVKKYNMQKHIEGGYFSQVYCSEQKVAIDECGEEMRPTMTSIYFLLDGENEFSAFHQLQSDEIWHHYDGCDVKIHILDDNGALITKRLGKEHEDANPQVMVPAKHWFAAEVTTDDFSFVGCTVTPGFIYKDFELADRVGLIGLYPQHQKLIERLTRENSLKKL